jgi:hypothetical protein
MRIDNAESRSPITLMRLEKEQGMIARVPCRVRRATHQSHSCVWKKLYRSTICVLQMIRIMTSCPHLVRQRLRAHRGGTILIQRRGRRSSALQREAPVAAMIEELTPRSAKSLEVVVEFNSGMQRVIPTDGETTR